MEEIKRRNKMKRNKIGISVNSNNHMQNNFGNYNQPHVNNNNNNNANPNEKRNRMLHTPAPCDDENDTGKPSLHSVLNKYMNMPAKVEEDYDDDDDGGYNQGFNMMGHQNFGFNNSPYK